MVCGQPINYSLDAVSRQQRNWTDAGFAGVYDAEPQFFVLFYGVITKFDPKSAGVTYGGYDYYTYQQQS